MGTAMLKRRSQGLCVWFLVSDLFITSGCWLLAYFLRFEVGWFPVTKSPPEPYYCWRYLPLVAFMSVVAFEITGQYAIHRLRRFREEVIAVLKGTALLALLVMATTFFTHD